MKEEVLVVDRIEAIQEQLVGFINRKVVSVGGLRLPKVLKNMI
jgi:hypothetical protein